MTAALSLSTCPRVLRWLLHRLSAPATGFWDAAAPALGFWNDGCTVSQPLPWCFEMTAASSLSTCPGVFRWLLHHPSATALGFCYDCCTVSQHLVQGLEMTATPNPCTCPGFWDECCTVPQQLPWGFAMTAAPSVSTWSRGFEMTAAPSVSTWSRGFEMTAAPSLSTHPWVLRWLLHRLSAPALHRCNETIKNKVSGAAGD